MHRQIYAHLILSRIEYHFIPPRVSSAQILPLLPQFLTTLHRLEFANHTLDSLGNSIKNVAVDGWLGNNSILFKQPPYSSRMFKINYRLIRYARILFHFVYLKKRRTLLTRKWLGQILKIINI